MSKIVRVDVDTQVGFCKPHGHLYVKNAESVIPFVIALNNDAIAKGMVLLGSVDTHDFMSPEFVANGGPFPPHCVKGTPDWTKVEGTLPERFVIIPPMGLTDSKVNELRDVLKKQGDTAIAIYFEKDRYSLFDNPVAELEINGLVEKGHDEFQVYGVALDYCVKAAALGIKTRHPEAKVSVIIDATVPVTAAGGEEAREILTKAGVDLIPFYRVF